MSVSSVLQCSVSTVFFIWLEQELAPLLQGIYVKFQGNKSASSRPHSMSIVSQCGEEQVAGDYSKHYVTLKQIGEIKIIVVGKCGALFN